jgi:thymidylate synthase
MVALNSELAAGRLLMTVKSAHVYDTELSYMREVLAAGPDRAGQAHETPAAASAAATDPGVAVT